MSNKYAHISSLTPEEQLAVIQYYSTHTTASTLRKFNLAATSRDKLNQFLIAHNVPIHSSGKSEYLKHVEADGFDQLDADTKQNILEYYLNHSMTCTCEKFKVKKYFVKQLAEDNGIKLHSVQEEIDLTKHQKFGYAFSTTEEEKDAIELEKYGQLGLSGREKAAITNKKLYGAENVFASAKIIAKLEQTKLQKYGDIHFTNRTKAKQTCMDRYGAETYLGSTSGQEKIKSYNQAKYGADYAFLSKDWQTCPEHKQKRASTLACKKYTTANYSTKYLDVAMDKDKFTEFVTNKTIYDIATQLSVDRDHVYYLLDKYNLLDKIKRQYDGTSQYEKEIVDYIGKDLCEMHNRQILNGKELDIYIPSKNLAIEFNGTHWHSTEVNKDKNYHFNKSILAASKGIRLIHIYEYEWDDPVQQSRIKMFLNIALGRAKSKIHARQCQIREISNREAKELNNIVHLQGHRNAQLTYGLFYKNELVQLMSFSKTKYNRNLKSDNAWEIIRGCPGSNNIVVGGVNKLFKHFIRTINPDSVFSYCDFNKFDGKSYELLGMKFIGYTKPDMKWVLPNYTAVTRCPSKHAELKEKAIAQIFGAGSKKYLWTNPTANK